MGSHTPIELTLAVEGAFKGDPSAEIVFVDNASYWEHDDGREATWEGSAGACGTFDADPTGVRALYSLYRSDDGTLESNRCAGSVIVEDVLPEDEAFVSEAIAEAEARFGPPRLPTPAPDDSDSNQLILVAAIAGVALVALAAGGAVAIARRR